MRNVLFALFVASVVTGCSPESAPPASTATGAPPTFPTPVPVGQTTEKPPVAK